MGQDELTILEALLYRYFEKLRGTSSTKEILSADDPGMTQALILAHLGKMDEAYRLISKLQHRATKKKLFKQLLDSYRGSQEYSAYPSKQEGSVFGSLVHNNHLIAARALLRWIRRHYRWDFCLTLYNHTRNPADLKRLQKCIGFMRPDYEYDANALYSYGRIAIVTQLPEDFARVENFYKSHRKKSKDCRLKTSYLLYKYEVSNNTRFLQEAISIARQTKLDSRDFYQIWNLLIERTNDKELELEYETLSEEVTREKARQAKTIQACLLAAEQTEDTQYIQRAVDMIFETTNNEHQLKYILETLQAISHLKRKRT